MITALTPPPPKTRNASAASCAARTSNLRRSSAIARANSSSKSSSPPSLSISTTALSGLSCADPSPACVEARSASCAAGARARDQVTDHAQAARLEVGVSHVRNETIAIAPSRRSTERLLARLLEARNQRVGHGPWRARKQPLSRRDVGHQSSFDVDAVEHARRRAQELCSCFPGCKRRAQ
eukprot:990557-Rhodomonas_salina.1